MVPELLARIVTHIVFHGGAPLHVERIKML